MLKDSIIFCKNINLLKSKCYSCNSTDHQIGMCDGVHLILDKPLKIKKFNHSTPTKNRARFKRKETRSVNARNLVGFITERNETSHSSEGQDDDSENKYTYANLCTDNNTNNQSNVPSDNDIKLETSKEKQAVQEFGYTKLPSNTFTYLGKFERPKGFRENSQQIKIPLQEMFFSEFEKMKTFDIYFPEFNIKNILLRRSMAKKSKIIKQKKRILGLNE